MFQDNFNSLWTILIAWNKIWFFRTNFMWFWVLEIVSSTYSNFVATEELLNSGHRKIDLQNTGKRCRDRKKVSKAQPVSGPIVGKSSWLWKFSVKWSVFIVSHCTHIEIKSTMFKKKDVGSCHFPYSYFFFKSLDCKILCIILDTIT